jgi:hypothetical protein
MLRGKRILAAAIALFLGNTGATAQALPWMRLPSEWGPLAPGREAGVSCPQLEGVYLRTGERYFVETRGGKESIDRAPTSSPIWSGHPRLRGIAARKSLPLEGTDASRSDKFWIVGNPPGAFDVRAIGRDKTRVEAITFRPESGDYVCSEGAVVFPAEDTEGYKFSDGVGTDVKAQTRVAKARDGALIYFRTLSAKGRSLFVFTSEIFRDEYYRFPLAGKL